VKVAPLATEIAVAVIAPLPAVALSPMTRFPPLTVSAPSTFPPVLAIVAVPVPDLVIGTLPRIAPPPVNE